MDGGEHALILLRAGHRQDVRIGSGDPFRFCPHAAGDHDLAVFRKRRADRGERFCLRAVEKAAGVDNRQVGIGVLAGEFVALRAQPRDNTLGIDQRFRAAKRDEGDARGAVHGRFESLLIGLSCLDREATCRDGGAPIAAKPGAHIHHTQGQFWRRYGLPRKSPDNSLK
jgi:hypothetical protein